MIALFGKLGLGFVDVLLVGVLLSQLINRYFIRAPWRLIQPGNWARVEAMQWYHDHGERVGDRTPVIRRLLIWSVIMLIILPKAPVWAIYGLTLMISTMEINFILACAPLRRLRLHEVSFTSRYVEGPKLSKNDSLLDGAKAIGVQ